MAAMDYAAGPDIRWYLSLSITAMPTLSIANLVGANKIVDDLDDDASANLLRDAVGETTLGIEPETASWRPYGSARGKKKAVGGEIQDFTLENGSSPRVRGTRRQLGRQEANCRFIPACAGNTSERRAGRSRTTVHPRVCGEHAIVGIGGDLLTRFIPACAGNTCPHGLSVWS